MKDTTDVSTGFGHRTPIDSLAVSKAFDIILSTRYE